MSPVEPRDTEGTREGRKFSCKSNDANSRLAIRTVQWHAGIVDENIRGTYARLWCAAAGPTIVIIVKIGIGRESLVTLARQVVVEV